MIAFFFNLIIKYTDFVNQRCLQSILSEDPSQPQELELVINSSGRRKTWVRHSSAEHFFSSTFIHINNLTWFKSTTLFFNHSYLFIYQSTIEDLEGQSLMCVWCKCIYIFKCSCSCMCAGACIYVHHVHMCVKSRLAVFLNHTAPYFLTQSLSLNFEFRNC